MSHHDTIEDCVRRLENAGYRVVPSHPTTGGRVIDTKFLAAEYAVIRLITSAVATASNLLTTAANEASLFDSELETELDEAARRVRKALDVCDQAHTRVGPTDSSEAS